MAFEISKEYLEDLWLEQKGLCAYTGIQMDLSAGKYETVSIDRISPKLGYVSGNIALCCEIVNRMKMELELDDFICWCSLVLPKTVCENK